MPTERHPEEDAQLSLLAGADAEVLDADERRGEFTGERLRRLRPEAYRAILEGYAGGAAMRQLARLYHVSTNTVSAIVQAEHSAIEAVKKRIGARATAVHALAFERLEEDLANDEVMATTSAKDKAVIVGITGDRMALADGTPTQITQQHVRTEDITDEFFRALRPAECPETGSAPGAGEQMGGAVVDGEFAEAAPEGSVLADLAPADGGAGDVSSPACDSEEPVCRGEEEYDA